MDNKRIVDILMISSIILLLIIFFFDIKCIFKSIFHIPCISCGLTRGFISIFKLDFNSAIKYNILSIPIFIILVIFYILYFISKIFKKDYVYNYYSFFVKHYAIMILILIVGWIINLINYF